MGKDNKGLRSLTWEDYGISKGRYKELQGFCLQYVEKKKAAAEREYGIPSGVGGSGGNGGKTASPTEAAAIRNIMRAERYLRDVRIIDEAAAWAAEVGGFPKAENIILWSVTRNVGYDRLCQRYAFVPWCNPDFYAVRRAFFHRLDELQQDQVEKNTPPGGSPGRRINAQKKGTRGSKTPAPPRKMGPGVTGSKLKDPRVYNLYSE